MQLEIRQFAQRPRRDSGPEARYWRAFKGQQVVPQFGPVTSVDYSPATNSVAVTASTAVCIYDSAGQALEKRLSNFSDVAYSGTFRHDGGALLAGGEQGVVQLFDTATRSPLRQFVGHTRAVRAVGCGLSKLAAFSASDDATARVWDVPTGEQTGRLTGHRDYVRACGFSPTSEATWATGSYDATVRIWDTRAMQEVLRLSHGAPVESLSFFPTGGLMATAGGHQVCVWDIAAGGKLLHCLRNHQKTVVGVRVHEDAGPPSLAESQGQAVPRMVTCSLDGHVKFHELDGFTVTHTRRFSSAVLCADLSRDANSLAVGLASGVAHLRRRERPRRGESGRRGPRTKRPLDASSRRFFMRGRSERAAEGDFKVQAARRRHVAPHDKELRRFRYREALDAALREGGPEVVVSVLEELAQRGGLVQALSWRDAGGLEPLLSFIHRHLPDPRYAKLLLGVAHRLLDIYGSSTGESPSVDHLLAKLRDRAFKEMSLLRELMQIQGILEPIVAPSSK